MRIERGQVGKSGRDQYGEGVREAGGEKLNRSSKGGEKGAQCSHYLELGKGKETRTRSEKVSGGVRNFSGGKPWGLILMTLKGEMNQLFWAPLVQKNRGEKRGIGIFGTL